MNRQSIKKLMKLICSGLVICGTLFFTTDDAKASPISTGANPYRSHIIPEEGNVAIYGYDPVAYFIEGRAVKGKDEFEHEFENARWRFSSVENRDAFVANPAAYLPQYGGFCTVCMVEHEGLFDANPKVWTIVKGKLYLNNNLRAAEKFRRNASLYIEWADKVWEKLIPPADLQIPDTNAQKIAIFPMMLLNRSNPVAQDVESAIKDMIKSYLDASESFEIAYHYDSAPAGGPVVTLEQVWPSGFGEREPDLDSVTKLAEQIGVGRVVMAWTRTGSQSGVERARVGLYVLELDQGNVYKEEGFVSEFNEMLQKAFPTRYKIAFFPLWLGRPGFHLAYETELLVRDKIKSFLKANESLELTYFYDAAPSGGPVIPPEQVWAGGFGAKAPVLESIIELAKQLGVQGVVTAYTRPVDSRGGGVGYGTVELYVIDVDQRSIAKESGLVSEIDEMLQKAFSK